MSANLNVAFFGSSLVSAYWNGAATYYRGIIRALHGRGHRITFYEPDAFDRQQHRDMEDPDWAEVVVYRANGTADVDGALDGASRADIVIKASGVGVLDEYLEAAVLELRSSETTVVVWDVDAPATLERLNRNPADAFRNHVTRYDLLLTYGGGRRGAATRLPSRRFLLGENGWAGKALPANVTYAGHVYTRDQNAFNSSPLAVLNINRESMARFGCSPPTRIFEGAGASACIVSDRWDGIELFLEPGREVLLADSGAEVAETIRGLSARRAAEIGRNGFRRILSEHTYAHRAAQVESVLTGSRAAQLVESRT